MLERHFAAGALFTRLATPLYSTAAVMTRYEALSFAHEPGRPQSWETLDDDLRAVIEHAVDRVADGLSSAGFVGAYLHGSLAAGSFYRPKSDVDMLFVVEDQMPAEQRARVAQMSCDLSEQLPLTGNYELSVLRRENTLDFHHPLPFELHYSSSNKAAIRAGKIDFAVSRTDPDLAVHCSDVRSGGVLLRGEPIENVFGPVPVEAYRQSIFEDLAWIVEDDHLLESPFYGILNCCRVLARGAYGWDRAVSKDEGGEWALEHLPKKYRPLVAQALACYRSQEPVPEAQRQTDGHAWDTAALDEFRQYVRQSQAR